MCYTERFVRGHVDVPFACKGESGGKHGLYVRFKPDPEIFETVVFRYDTVLGRMREQAFLNAGVRIRLHDLRGEEIMEDDLCYEGGIRSFVEYLNRTIHSDVIYVRGARGDMTAEVALQYNDSYTETIYTFANNMATVEGGTHDVGFKTALTKAFNDYGRKKGILKASDDNFKGEDVREGICAVVSVKLPDAQFESQTKAKLGNSEVRSFVDSIVKQKLVAEACALPTGCAPPSRPRSTCPALRSWCRRRRGRWRWAGPGTGTG